MQQIEIFEIPSPCIDVCQTNSRGYCLGCYRSREERFQWLKMDVSQKKKVLILCQQRRKRHQQKIAANKNTSEHNICEQKDFGF
ncbi:DUF1289 domain-containing protein [Pseudoalteromonas denitrificans]|uniref:Uncharacterized protein n=1 Tax=Pseudoalteromonas denitrificans DSM 6059 TaxID=1123010 RepID=A0A1I1E7K6_9GAMM|nr:DUF1289 domain-containing protein [Pseudoalteromonas denitrificans]SFB83054.1 hypothetical protein SAMN02745724_00260 [Pseudoalteromonas denitrificans DSM 6059]